MASNPPGLSPVSAARATDRTASTAVTATSRRRRWGAQDLSLIAVFAALMVVSAVVPPIQIGNLLGVPLTLQTFVVTLAGLLLGPARGFAAVGLYTVIGLLGLPIFSGFRGGLAILVSPSAGYLLAFPFVALIIGWLAVLAVRSRRWMQPTLLIAAGLVGLVVDHAAGILGMIINGKLAAGAALGADLVFVPGDVLKVVLTALVALSLHRAFPALLRRR
ncbi:biotin transporter BioY [Psychromicrobium xiongbiense]|uniref:biotin transporter BioY n=1 Tax=Psychromicrobium xiongbiense TaxID=3051184 RepID=UPI0025527076|nr:biotin transporter BioY [Psychromicrobium sp. YIM S02556]